MADVVIQAREDVARRRLHEAHGWGSPYPYRLIEDLIAEVERLRANQRHEELESHLGKAKGIN